MKPSAFSIHRAARLIVLLAALATVTHHVGAQAWQLDPTFAPAIVNDDFSDAITNVIVMPTPDGRFLLAGRFNRVDDVNVRSLARFHRDFTFDGSFGAQLAPGEGFVSAAPLADGRVLLAIDAARFDYRIVRLHADGRRDQSFPALSVTGPLQLWPLPGGAVLARGNFSSIGGQVFHGIARFDPSGALETSFRPQIVSFGFSAGLPGPHGTLVIGNVSSGFPNAQALVRLHADGSLDPTFAPVVHTAHQPRAVQPDGSVIALADNRLVRFRTDGTLDPTYAQDRRLAVVSSIDGLSDGRVVVQASDVGRQIKGTDGPFYVLSPDGAIERELRAVPGTGEFKSIITTLPDDRVLIAQGWRTASDLGSVISYTFEDRNAMLVSPNGATLGPIPSQLAIRSASSVRAIVLDADGHATIQGLFSHVNGQRRPGIARLTRSGQLDSTYAPTGVNHSLRLLLADGGAIVQRGVRSAPDTDNVRHATTEIARLRPDGSAEPGFQFSGSPNIFSTRWLLGAPDGRLLIDDGSLAWLTPDGRLAQRLPVTFAKRVGSVNVTHFARLLADGHLLIGGTFTHVNNMPRAGLVRLQADGAIDETYAPDLSSLVTIESAVPLPDGRAVVFGNVWHNGVFIPRAIRVDAHGRPESDHPTTARFADGLVLRDGSLVGAQQRFGPDGLRDLNFDPQLWSGNTPGQLEAAVVGPDGSLWLGGRFDEVALQRRLALARFLPQESRAITVGPRDTTIAVGGSTQLQVAIGTTHPATYQWTHDGVAVPGATRAVLEINPAQPADAGAYRALLTFGGPGGQTLTSAPANLTVTPNTARLVNLSARSKVEPDAPQIAGVVCSTPFGLHPILLRAVGFGFPGSSGVPMLPVPVLTVQNASRTLATDRGSVNSPEVAALARTVGAFPITTEPLLNSTWIRGSAVTLAVGSGAFTAITTSGNGNSGLSIFEFYDASDLSHPPLARNLSIRGRTSPGVNVLTAGFVVAGNGPLRVLVRGIGPGLTAFGLTTVTPDPLLRVYAAGVATPLATNAAWAGEAAITVAGHSAGAFPLAANSRDTAVLLTLEPGAYTVQLAGSGDTPTEALIELYALDP